MQTIATLEKAMAALELRNQRFGRLLVKERMPPVPGARNVFWHCECDCGNTTIVAAANLGRNTSSCGCLAKETAAELLKGNKYTLTHGRSHTPEHNTWMKIQERCNNTKDHKFPIYGARGIKVCQRWLDDFMNFYNDMGPRPSSTHSIDRINNDGDYEPGNCRWATRSVQARNKRNTIMVEIDGRLLPLVTWCDVIGVKKSRIQEMIRARGGREPRFSSWEEAMRFIHRQWQAGSLRKYKWR